MSINGLALDKQAPMTHSNYHFSNPAGDLFSELEDQDIIAGINGGCKWYNLSCNLGNKGAYCTLTIECMPSCN